MDQSQIEEETYHLNLCAITLDNVSFCTWNWITWEIFLLELGNGHNLGVTVNVGFRGKYSGYRNHCWRFESDTIRWFQFVSRRIPLPNIHSKLAGEGVPLMPAAWMRFLLLPSRVSCVLLCTSLLLLLLLCCILLLLVVLSQVMWGPSRHLGSLTAANWVSFDFNVSYSSCWGQSLIITLQLKKIHQMILPTLRKDT